MVEMFLLAFGLAADSFAVAVSIGAASTNKYRTAIKTAIIFGIVQGVIPLVGWALGLTIKEIFMSLNHWVAVAILGYLGLRMLLKAGTRHTRGKFISITSNSHLLVLALATSIDAMVIGFSFAFLDENIGLQLLIIGGVTTFMSFIGVMIGEEYAHHHIRKLSVVLGGCVLLFIAAKILVEHLLTN